MPLRLFGATPTTPTDLLAHEPFLERARVERQAGRFVEARVALAAYSTARLLNHLLDAEAEALDVAELLVRQCDYVQRALDELPSGAEVSHLRGIVAGVREAQRAGEAGRGPLRVSLTAWAYHLEHEGRLHEALDVLQLVARSHALPVTAAEFAPFALFVARLNRMLARWPAAAAAYLAAEEAGLACQDLVPVYRGRLGRAAVLRGQGNLPAARAMVEQVIAEATAPELRDVQAGAYADLGVVLLLAGARLDALQALYQAFLRTTDPLQRMRTLGDLGIGLYEIGAVDVARKALEIVVDSDVSQLVRVNACLELMEIESAAGSRVAFERRRGVARDFLAQMPPSMAVDYYFKSGVGLARFGQLERGRAALESGRRLAEEHQLHEWYFRIERTITELPRAIVPAPRPALPAADEAVVAGFAEGFEEYAAARRA